MQKIQYRLWMLMFKDSKFTDENLFQTADQREFASCIPGQDKEPIPESPNLAEQLDLNVRECATCDFFQYRTVRQRKRSWIQKEKVAGSILFLPKQLGTC
jgi:hypothetical protein